MHSREQQIFKQGSTTFFLSSLFFPKAVKQDVFDLYSFVRVADDYVDQVPSDKDGFYHLRTQWKSAVTNPNFTTDRNPEDVLDITVIKNMLRVARKHHFDLEWIDAFLDAMQSDLVHKEYVTIEDTLHYIYGSAEVIGLMMANIMGLAPEAAEAARMQGRAMQIINFIRDINEDIELGRRYFPAQDLERFNLADISMQTATAQPEDFQKFIQIQIERYNQWQTEAYNGYKYIPRRLRIPLHTATDMYNWTAQEIKANPLVIFERKVKPSKVRVLARALTNIV